MKDIKGVMIDNKDNICIYFEDGSTVETPLENHTAPFMDIFNLSEADWNLLDIQCQNFGRYWEVVIYAYSKDGKPITLDLIRIDQEFLRDSLPF